MDIEFYNVKTRQKVSIAQDKVTKTKMESTSKSGSPQVRYALKAQVDGVRLTKFISKDDFEKLQVPEDK